MKNAILKIILAAAIIPLLAGCLVVRERPARVYAPPPGEVVVETPPPMPPPQTEIVPVAPGSPEVWLWIGGSWEWRGHWVWVRGHWIARPHQGAVWVPGGWAHRGPHFVWVPGHWQ